MKKVLTIITIMVILLSISVISNAAIEITEEKLEESFNKMLQESEDTSGYSFDKEKDMILFKNEDGTVVYELKYKLEDKPKFYIDMKFEKSMTKEEAEEELSKPFLPGVGFALTNNIIGIDYEDAMMYFISKYMETAMQYDNNQTLEYTNGIEYVKEFYPNQINSIVNDKLFDLTVSKQQETETEYIFMAELIVNTENDFSELNGFTEELGQDIQEKLLEFSKKAQMELEKAIEKEKEIFNNIMNDTGVNVVANIQKIPQTGNEISLQKILYSVIVIATLLGVCLTIYNKKH